MQPLRCEVYPVVLGGGRAARRVLSRLSARAPKGAALLAGRRPFLWRAPSPLSFYKLSASVGEELLCAILAEVAVQAGDVLPLLVVCDAAFSPFVLHCRADLEHLFVLRFGEGMEVEP